MSLPFASAELGDGRVFVSGDLTQEFAQRLLALVDDPNDIQVRAGYGVVVPASVAAALEAEAEPEQQLPIVVEDEPADEPADETPEPTDESTDESATKTSSKSSK